MEWAFAAVLAVLVAAESGASDTVPYLSPGISIVGVMGALVILFKFQRSIVRPLERRATDTDHRLAEEVGQRRECEWRLGELVDWLREEGMAVPDRIKWGRPPWGDHD